MTERADLAGIGRLIAEIRREVGLTQEQLAERAGISVVHLCNIELGKKTPGLTVLIRTAEALEVATDRILRAETPGTYAVANKKIGDLLEDCTSAEMLMPRLDDAVQNADIVMQTRIRQYKKSHNNENYPFCDWNSFTNVHKLIDALRLEEKTND